MNRVVLVVATNRPTPRQTEECLKALRARGAFYVLTQGSSDVAYARNASLSVAARIFRERPDHDVALLVDDDMVFSVEQAEQVIQHARASGVAAAAIYPTAASKIAATQIGSPTPGRWLVGLGFVAVPRAALLKLADESAMYRIRGQECYEFTRSASFDGRWFGEDYWLCYRLGGVDLLPIAVGHLKMCPLYANEETIEKVRLGVPLGGHEEAPAPYRISTGEGTGFEVSQP